RPRQPVLGHAPGVLQPLHAPESALQLAGELALHHDEIAAHIEDVEHRLVAHRTDLDTGAAARAGPDRALADGIVQQRQLVWLARRQLRHTLADVVALVDLQRRRAQLLAGD